MALRKKSEAEQRKRFVRVALTEEEHTLLRAAAAAADLSLSQYAVQAIVAAAGKDTEQLPRLRREEAQEGRAMTFGKHLQALRHAAGLAQVESARQCDVARKLLPNWKADRAQPRMDALLKLARRLETTLDALIASDVNKKEKPKKSRGRPPKQK